MKISRSWRETREKFSFHKQSYSITKRNLESKVSMYIYIYYIYIYIYNIYIYIKDKRRNIVTNTRWEINRQLLGIAHTIPEGNFSDYTRRSYLWFVRNTQKKKNLLSLQSTAKRSRPTFCYCRLPPFPYTLSIKLSLWLLKDFKGDQM